MNTNTDTIIDGFNSLTNYCTAWGKGRHCGGYNTGVYNIAIRNGRVSFSINPSSSGMPLACSFPIEYLTKYTPEELTEVSRDDFRLEVMKNSTNRINIETLKNALMDTKEYHQLKDEVNRQKMSLQIEISQYCLFPNQTLKYG